MLLSGCLDAPPTLPHRDAATDGAESFVLESAHAATRGGEPRTWTAVPMRPSFHVSLSSTPTNAAEAIFVVAGELDSNEVSDFESLPLRVDTQTRLVPVTIETNGIDVSITPQTPLRRSAPYSFVVAPFLETTGAQTLTGAVRVYPMRTSNNDDDGALLAEAWPADGSTDVPTSLMFAMLRFDGSVQHIDDGVRFGSDDDYPVPRSVRKVECGAYGFRAGMCVLVAPLAELDPSREYTVTTNAALCDGTGASLEPVQVHFRTSSDGTNPAPRFQSPACAIDEVALDVGCALTDDSGLVLRADAQVPVRAWLTLGRLTDHSATARGDLLLQLQPLPPETPLVAELVALDLSGVAYRTAVPFQTAPPLPTLSITEVLADPLGTEPSQEFVEVTNFGDEAIELLGFSLSDRAESIGDVLPRARLAAHAQALVVADSFDANSEVDTRVPPGVTLIRIGTSLGSGGLTNRGEPLYLRDPSMHRLSAAPPFEVAASGRCYARIGTSMRAGSASDFSEVVCTPGTAR